MALAWNFRPSLLFFPALARRCKGWHSLGARFLTLRRVSPFFMLQVKPDSFSHTCKNNPEHISVDCAWWQSFPAPWKNGGRGFESILGVERMRNKLRGQVQGACCDPAGCGYSPCSRAGRSRCPRWLGCWWCGCPCPQQADRSTSCSPSSLSPLEPHWDLLAGNPPHETRCLRLRRKGTVLSRHFNPNTCSSQSHPKAETYPVPAFSCQWALGQGSHPFSLPPFSAFLSPTWVSSSSSRGRVLS